MDRKFNKTVIIRLQRPMRTNLLKFLLVSPRPACRSNMSSNDGFELEQFSRENNLFLFYIFRDRPIRFRCFLQNTIYDVLKSRGWIESRE
jgi:hypothetical protein